MTSRRTRWEYYDLAFGPPPSASLDQYEALFAARASRPVKNVLELGCGTGRYLTALAQRGYELTGVDIDEDALALAGEKFREMGLHADLAQADLGSWKPHIATYDAIISPNNSLKWLESHESLRKCITKASKALRPGGILIFDLTLDMTNWRNTDWGTEEDMAEHVWISKFAGEDISGEYRCHPGVPDVSKGLMPFIEAFSCRDGGEEVAFEDRTTWLMFSAKEIRQWMLEIDVLEGIEFYNRREPAPVEIDETLLDEWCLQCLIVARRRP